MGAYADIHAYNIKETSGYSSKVYSCVRWSENEKLIIVSNFSDVDNAAFELKIPAELVEKLKLKGGDYEVVDQIFNSAKSTLSVKDGIGGLDVKLAPLQSFIFKL